MSKRAIFEIVADIGDIHKELAEIRQWREEMETVLKDLCASVQNLIEDLSKVQIILGEMMEE
jgi:CHAD domain-containing protein